MAQQNPFDPTPDFHPDQQNNVFPEPQADTSKDSGYVPMTSSEQTVIDGDNSQTPPGGSSTDKLSSLKSKQASTSVTVPPEVQPINTPQQQAPQETTVEVDDAQNVNFQPKGFGVIQPEVIMPQQEAEPADSDAQTTAGAGGVGDSKQPEGATFWTSPRMMKIKAFAKKRWYVVFIGASLLIGLIIGAVVVYRSNNQVDTNLYTNVSAQIEAPITSPSGSPSTWRIRVRNNETVPIENIEIDLEFDPAFKFLSPINPQPAVADGTKYSIARLDGQGNGVSETFIAFEGILTGNIDEETIMRGTISYTPLPIRDRDDNRRAISITEQRTKIIAPEIRVEINPDTDKIENGGDLGIAVVFENLSDRELDDIQIEVDYPDNGQYLFSGGDLSVDDELVLESPTNSNNIWRIDSLPRLKEGRVQIDGQVQSTEGIRITFDVRVSIRNSDGEFQVLGSSSADVQVTSQSLVINTFIEGRANNRTFSPGDVLTFVVDYQNKGTSTVRAVEIVSQVDDPANILDYSTLRFVGGDAGNSSNRSVQWRAANNPQLENLTPQARGTLRYSITVKDDTEFLNTSLTQTQYTLRPSAQAQAQNVDPAFATGDLYRATGDLEFEQIIEDKGECNDQANCRVYTVTWNLSNTQNVVNDVSIQTRSALPPTMWNQSSIIPVSEASNVSYNVTTGQIVWNAGTIDSYTGVNNDPATMSFDVIVIDDSPSRVEIFGPTDIRGIDDVTGQTYQFQGPSASGRNAE